MSTVSPAIAVKYNAGAIEADWRSGNDEVMAKEVAGVLERHYPGYLWGAHVNVREGLIDLVNFHVSGDHGYVLKLQGLFSWDRLRDEVMRAGGEILERAGLPRAGYNEDRVRTLARDFRRLPIIDRSR